MKKLLFTTLAILMAALSSCGGKTQSSDNQDVVCGGYSDLRLLTADDSLAFSSAVKDNENLKPVLVSSQIVAGTNYNFRCEQMNADSTFSSVDVKVFQPLEGEPKVDSIVKLADADETGYLVRVGEMAPDFTVTLADGRTVKLSELRGKVVMLQFSASWCSVCRREMPFIERDIWQKHKDNADFVLMGIDRDEPLPTVEAFASQVGITYPLGLDPDAGIYVRYALKQSGITRNVLIDREGRIVKLTRLYNEEEFAGLVVKIDELLGEK